MPAIRKKIDHQDQRDILEALVNDVTELRAKLIATLAKLDADAGVTDADFASTLTPAALTTTKS